MAELKQSLQRKGDRSGGDEDLRLRELLGRAVADCWGILPKETQQTIYERAAAISCPDDHELCRERLAVYLHNQHPRTERQVPLPEEISAKPSAGLSEEVETELDSRRWRD